MSRVVAAAVDGAVVLVLLFAGYAAFASLDFLLDPRGFTAPAPGRLVSTGSGLVVLVVYQALAWWLTGRTYGGRVIGLRVVGRHGRPPGLAVALLRSLLTVSFPLGVLWVPVGRRNRSVQDLLLGTSVVYDWHAPGERAVTTGPGGATGAALAARPEAPAPPRVPAPVPVSGPERTGRRSPGGGVLANAATLAGLLVLFFSVPVRAGQSPGALVRSSAIAAAGVAMVAWVVVRQVRGSGRRELTPLQLVLLAEIVAIVFALVYYSLALAGDNFVGVRTRLDALYFTLTTMTTVGYGDVRPTSQLARGVVSAHLVFNLVFLGTLARLLQRRVAERRR